MDVEWPLRCISKSPQESVVERLSSSFQEFFSTPFREPIIWRAWDCGLLANRDPDTAVSDAGGKMDKAKGTARNVAGDVKSFQARLARRAWGCGTAHMGAQAFGNRPRNIPQAIELMSTRFYQGEMS